VAKESYEPMKISINNDLELILKFALIYAQYAGWSTISEKDLILACKKININVYIWQKLYLIVLNTILILIFNFYLLNLIFTCWFK
jgi:hypothetical protein